MVYLVVATWHDVVGMPWWKRAAQGTGLAGTAGQ